MPIDDRPRRSIRGVLLGALGLVAVVPFLPLGALIFIGYRDDVWRVEREIQATNRQFAVLAAHDLDGFFRDVEAAARGAVRAGGAIELPAPSADARWEVADDRGNVVVSQVDAGREGHDCGYRDVLPKAVVSAEPVHGPFAAWLAGRAPVALVVMRAGDPPGSRFVAGLIDPLTLRGAPMGDAGQAVDRREYMIDRAGTLLFASDPAVLQPGMGLRANPPVALFRRGRSGPIRYESTITGKQRLGYVQPTPSGERAVVVSADIGSRLIQLRDRYVALGWTILFAFVAVAGIGGWTTRRLLRPVLRIRDALRSESRQDRAPLDVRPGELGTTEYAELVGAFDDLERRLAVTEASLLQAEKNALLGQLSAGIAHEFGTPLNVISGNAQFLMRRMTPDDPQRQVLEKIVKQAQRLAEMIRRVMDFARPVEPQMRAVDLRRVVNRALEMVSGMVGKTRVEARVDPGTPPVQGDPAMLEHALLNLVVNALQAMPDGGALTVEAAPEDTAEGAAAGALLRVTDTGCGIPQEHLAKVFEPFYTTKPPDAGTGLGLAIVERIARQHGGRVEARSRAGEGAVFTIHLRRAEQGEDATEDEA